VVESQQWQLEEDLLDQLRFPLLADPELKVCRAYGVYDAHNEFTLPAVIVVRREDGAVSSVRPSESIADRPSTDDVLDAVKNARR
jgi:peroxiredoxin